MSVGARDISEIRIATSGDVYIAPAGTPLPSTVRTPLHSDFYQVGFVGEDGAGFEWQPVIEDFSVLQEANPVRRELAEQRVVVSFQMLQWNAETVGWAFGGGHVIQLGPSSWRYDWPSSDERPDDRSLVLDWNDGDVPGRLVLRRGVVLGGVSTTLARKQLAALPVNFDALGIDADGSPGFMFWNSAPSIPEPEEPGGPGEFGEGTFGDGLFGG